MQNPVSIVEMIDEHLNSSDVEVPVFHAVAVKLQQVLAKPDFCIEQATQLIVADQSLASQVLRVANSAFYAGLSKVRTIQDAVIRLGAREVASITMLATQHDFYCAADQQFNTVMQTLWKHSLCCAVASRWLAGKCGFRDLAAEAFIAGLLHDIGKLFLLKVLEDMQKSGKLATSFPPSLLLEVLQSMHVGSGHGLIERWNMPESYCTIVREHHSEPWASHNHMLAMVRMADKACNKAGIGMNPDPGQVLLATEEAQVLGLKEITLAQLEIVIEDAMQQQVMSGAA